MVEIIRYNTPQEFLDQNREYIYGNYFGHYHLINIIEGLKRQKYDLFDSFNVVDDNGSNVLCMWITGSYYLYSDHWSEDVVIKLSEIIDIKKFTNFSFCGQSDLLAKLFEYSEVQGEIFKKRHIEVCDETLRPEIEFKGKLEVGNLNDIEELIELDYAYNQEEFKGQGSQTIESISNNMPISILEESIFVWRDDGDIKSIVKIINENEKFAFIGSLYTKPDQRNKGYGYMLMHNLTNYLLGGNYQKCGLVSDRDNPITQKVFQKVGYIPIYKWALIRKK